MARRHGGGAHGGSWKVAYADFVTSMMAFFLVLWLMGTDQETRMLIQEYFRGEKDQQGRKGMKDDATRHPMPNPIQDKSSKDLVALNDFRRTMEHLRDQLNSSPEMGDDLIRFEFMADGVRITAIDRQKKPFFEPETANLTKFGTFVLRTIALVIERYPFDVEVEGHTQKQESEKSGVMGAWDLSTLRASSAQRALEFGGVHDNQFFRVAGYSDRQPIDNDHPDSEDNRRISVIVRPKQDMMNIDQLREAVQTR